MTLTLCSPTERGTKSALNTPSAVCDTCAGIDCPDGPVCFFFVAIAIDFTSNSDAKKSNEVFVFTFLSMFFVLN